MADIAPAPRVPERAPYTYERKVGDPRANYNTARRGPLRFEEGVATDTDVPNEFQKGILQGYATPPGRPNHNLNVFEKPAEETMHERAHVGSAAWVDSPDVLSEFASGSFADYSEYEYQQVVRDGSHQARTSAAVVND